MMEDSKNNVIMKIISSISAKKFCFAVDLYIIIGVSKSAWIAHFEKWIGPVDMDVTASSKILFNGILSH